MKIYKMKILKFKKYRYIYIKVWKWELKKQKLFKNNIINHIIIYLKLNKI